MRRFLFTFVCALAAPAFVHAQVVITEIMYDLAGGSDSGREWIEIFNAGNSPVSLRDFKVVESGSSHKIGAVAGGDRVAAGSYAVIADTPAKFKNDYPAYAGQLFDSAFSLSNSGETIGIADAQGTIIDSVSYTAVSANGTGDSLQRAPSSNVFAAGIPTPGVGIPASGLAKSPPKPGKAAAKKSTTAKSTAPVSVGVPLLVGDDAKLPSQAFVAAATISNSDTFYWWLAPLFLAFVAAVGIVWSRHLKKAEWDIVEEIEETG